MRLTNRILIFTFAFVAANELLSVIKAFTMLLACKRFGHKCNQFTFFWWHFMRGEDGKFKKAKNKETPTCNCNVTCDLSKAGYDYDKGEIALNICAIVVNILFIGIMCLLFWPCLTKFLVTKDYSALEFLMGSFLIGLIINEIVKIGIYLYTKLYVMKGLGGYIDANIKKLRRGIRFQDMNMQPLENLPYKNNNKTSELLYNSIYVYALYELEDFDKLKSVSYQMADYLENKEFLMQYAGAICWLVFYFSKFETNMEGANKFYCKIENVILKDDDANSKRVLAYYNYYILNDKEKAMRYVKEGLLTVDKFSVGDERELEKKWLEELYDILLKN